VTNDTNQIFSSSCRSPEKEYESDQVCLEGPEKVVYDEGTTIETWKYKV